MRYVWASGSHTGLVRDNNEDSIHPEHDGYCCGPLVVAVADGLGGHTGGEVASRKAINGAVAATGSPARRVEAANTEILNTVVERPRLAGMGTTLTLGQLDPDGRVTLGHVGDSRAYLLRGGDLLRLTVDHTFVQQEVDAGRLTEEEARVHPHRAHLTRALGFEFNVEVDVVETALVIGDRLLVCSDGVTEMLSDDRIAAILGVGAPSDAVWGLIEAANHAGGRDNVSAVVVLVKEDTEQ